MCAGTRLSLPLQQRNHCLMTMTICSSRADHESYHTSIDGDCASYKSLSLLGWKARWWVEPECFSWVEELFVCDIDLHVCHGFVVGHISVLLKWFISIIMPVGLLWIIYIYLLYLHDPALLC
jgi:hypothetical protein